jgi:hypothetical protein
MKNSKTGRFLVILEKVTFPDGTVKTLPSIPSSIERPAVTPQNINQVLQRLEREYKKLVEDITASSSPVPDKRFAEAVTSFLEAAEELNVRMRGLGLGLSRDAGISPDTLSKILEQTRYIKNLVNYIAKWNKKEKKNAIKYAEAIEELTDLVGSCEGTVAMLSNKIKIGPRTVGSWCKIAGMPDEVKKLISEGGLPPTTAFMIPATDAETQIQIAEAISGLPQTTAKRILKYLETHPDEDPIDVKTKVLGS